MRIAPPPPRVTRAALKEHVPWVDDAYGRDAGSAREEVGSERCAAERVRLLDELAHGPAFVRSSQDVGQLRTRLHKGLSPLLGVHSNTPLTLFVCRCLEERACCSKLAQQVLLLLRQVGATPEQRVEATPSLELPLQAPAAIAPLPPAGSSSSRSLAPTASRARGTRPGGMGVDGEGQAKKGRLQDARRLRLRLA